MDTAELRKAVLDIYLGIVYDLPEGTDLNDVCCVVGDMMFDKFGFARDNGLEDCWTDFAQPILKDYY